VSTLSNPAGKAADAAAKYTQSLADVLGDRAPLDVMREQVAALRHAVADLSAAELGKPEASGKWSILHVLDHLADAESVLSYRFRSVIAEDQPPLRGYDQELWAKHLRYGVTPASTVLAELEPLRARNLRLLASLRADELERAGLHSERGLETVDQMLKLTAAHDLVHRRQIGRIRAALGKPL